MVKRIKIGVISDLHCTYSKEYESQDTILFSNTLKFGNRKNQVLALLRLIKDNNLTCDYLLCPGDITNKMDVQGLISGYGYLREIQSALCAKQLICTPGNHDIDFCRENRSLFPHACDSLKHLDVANYPLSDQNLSNLLLNEGACVYSDDEIAILCVNSVTNFTDKDSAREIFLSETLLTKIDNMLQRIPETIKIRVALTHHHPIMYTDLNFRKYNVMDFIKNGDQLIEVIDRHHFGLLIHGHKHKAKLKHLESVTLFCAGSFSAKQNTQLGDDENLFHIIEIEPENPMKGIIHSWSYGEGSSWKPSHHFPEITGFGATKSGTELADEVGSYLKKQYKDALRTVPFQDIVELFPEVQYLHEKEKNEFYERLIKYDCMYSMSLNNLKMFIINSSTTTE